jgi:hypothetical protein
MCAERKLHTNWRSPADTPILSPTVVAGLRVRYSRHRSSPEMVFVRKICSWTDLFVMKDVREPRFHCIFLRFSPDCRSWAGASVYCALLYLLSLNNCWLLGVNNFRCYSIFIHKSVLCHLSQPDLAHLAHYLSCVSNRNYTVLTRTCA